MKRELTTLILTYIFANSAFAKSEKDLVLEFFKEHNISERTVATATPVTTTIYRDEVPYILEYSRTVKFSPITETKSGLSFDVTYDVEYSLTKDRKKNKKKETVKPELKKRHVVKHFELREVKSTDDVLGYVRILEDSDGDSTGEAYTLSAEINANQALELKETQIMFTDESLDDGVLFPGATASTSILSLDRKGKLILDQAFVYYEVNPDTFERVPLTRENGDPMDPIKVISVEQDGKASK